MPSKPIRFFWFISSYTPLWVILCISNWPINKTEGWLPLSIFFVAISAVSNAIVVWYLERCRKSSRHHTGEIIVAKAVGDLSREYIATYAISLIGFNLLGLKGAISFAILIAFFAFLYIRHDQIIYNPMLELFGYRTYEISMLLVDIPKENDEYRTRNGVLISRKTSHALQDGQVPLTPIGHDNLFVEVRT